VSELTCDIAVVGAGAAGLFAAIHAGRALTGTGRRVLALDGAKTLGAKILVAGGGRCNVTHDVVDERAYAGSTRPAIRNVLGRFGVPQTIAFFRELGVELKREDTGKLFPVSDDGRTVLEALLRATRDAQVRLVHPWRVQRVRREGEQFVLEAALDAAGGPVGPVLATRVVLATGGKALPRSGSDGAGYEFVRELGHTLTPRIFPALVPLTLPKDHWLCGLSGLAAEVGLDVRSSSGKRLHSFTGSLLCTHFGISGPVALDISRYLIDARAADPGATLSVNWLVDQSEDAADAAFVTVPASGAAKWLASRGLPERLARALTAQAGVDASRSAAMPREERRRLARALTASALPVTGDRGFTYAEVTAGGVPLSEVRLDTMESRVCPGLHLCGEILDVDGRIGGYNFQWAWASGFVAGRGAAGGLGVHSPA